RNRRWRSCGRWRGRGMCWPRQNTVLQVFPHPRGPLPHRLPPPLRGRDRGWGGAQRRTPRPPPPPPPLKPGESGRVATRTAPAPPAPGEGEGSRVVGRSATHRTPPTPNLSPQEGGERPGGHPDIPNGNALIELLQSGPTNAHPERGEGIVFPLARYRELLQTLSPKIRDELAARWGDPAADPFVRGDNFHLPAIRFGNVAILLQPS